MNTIPVLRPLALPNYRRLFLAMMLAIFGQGAWALYLAMQTLDLGANPAQLASVVVWSGVGLLTSSIPAGIVADRVSKRKILLAVMLLNTAITAGTTSLALSGLATYWQLACSAFLVGSATAFFFPAYTALVPTMVEPDHLMAVNGLEGATRPVIGQALAPALVGATIGASIPPAGGAIVALAYALATAFAFSLPTTSPTAPTQGAAPHPLQDLIDGFRYVAITPWVAISVTFAATMTLLTVGPLEVLLPTLLRHGHDNGAAVYGAVLAALGLGGLAGSLTMGSRPAPAHFLRSMILLWGAGCLPFALAALTLNPWALAAVLFIYGAMIGAGMVIWGAVLQEHVPLVMLGRVASLDFFISIAFMPLSIATTGLLAHQLGTHTLFLAAGLGPLAISISLLVTGRLRSPATQGTS